MAQAKSITLDWAQDTAETSSWVVLVIMGIWTAIGFINVGVAVRGNSPRSNTEYHLFSKATFFKVLGIQAIALGVCLGCLGIISIVQHIRNKEYANKKIRQQNDDYIQITTHGTVLLLQG